MAGPSDHELIAEIQAGRRDALGLLFDRYSQPLFEFIYYIIGDRDQAARLLEEVFSGLFTAIVGLGDTETIRGWLYTLAGEASLSYLRQRGWSDALPPSQEPAAGGLSTDIWYAARRIPAYLRMALLAEELHGLSPTEKARVLNVPRTELPRVIEQARSVFNAQFDTQARLQNSPTLSQVDPEKSSGLRRRVPTSHTLFGFLPVIRLSPPLAQAIRSQVAGGGRPVELPEEPVLPVLNPEIDTIDEPYIDRGGPARIFPEGCSLPVILGALIIALLITAIAAFIGFSYIRDSSAPTISNISPADKSTVQIPTGATSARVIISAVFRDDRAVNVRTVRFILDGNDVTSQALVNSTGLSYPVDLAAGQHIAYIEVYDSAGNKSSVVWQFTVLAPIEPTGTPTMTPTVTPVPTASRTPSLTPTVTPVPPTIASFTASATNVRSGTSVSLAWSVTGADTVFLNTDKVDLTGTRVVTPTVTTTYHLIATNGGGTTDKTLTITVQSLPDLTVTDIAVNSSGQVVYTIKNLGPGDVTQMFLIQVFADGAPIDSNRLIPSLPAGQDKSLTVPNYTLQGTHLITVRVNASQEIPEVSFGNNELTRSLIGATPTPTITSTPTRTNTPTATFTPTRTPTVTPTIAAVTNVTMTITSSNPYTGTCPANASLSGGITTNGPATVQYRWERPDQATSVQNALIFSSAGTQTVTYTWPNMPAGQTQVWLTVTSPNDATSPRLTYTNNCR